MLDPLAVFIGNTINERGFTSIPLVSTDHEVALASGLAVVTTHRLFRNSESANIEAVLTFPVPVHATLFHLTAETDGRVLHAKAQARSKAREVYEDAVTLGKSAVLHEELLKGIHMISVANIQPGGEIKVTTKWAMPLSVADGRSTLRIPQTVGDVYGRSGLCDADELLTGGPAQPVMVSIQSECPVEVVGAQLVNGRATVSSADPIDLVVSLWEAIPIMGRDAGGRNLSLMLTPQSGGETPLDVAVLVDHSGSMTAQAVSRGSFSAHDAARNGIAALAKELAAGDHVDLWEFDTEFRQIGMTKSEASDLSAASERLAYLATQLSPPSGGTEIGGALKAVIRFSSAKDILLLTDGLSHQLNIEKLARCGRRISVILIGAGSLEARIGHLAALTGGDLFIATADDLSDVMTAAISALRRPTIALPTVTNLPDEIMLLRNNVEIRANWTQDTCGEMTAQAVSRGSFSAHDAARNGIAALAKELAAGDHVDLWEFDTEFRQIGMTKSEASDLSAASERLAYLATQLSPPSGGTEIGGALKAVIRFSSAKDILLLTDGLSHQLNIEKLARCGRRISVILIGAGSLEARIGHLAALTGGDLFIATADDLSDVMTAAISALRRPTIALPTVTNLPDEIMLLRNNVEIRANWTQDTCGEKSSEISKAATAVAASLVVNCATPAVAAKYAVSEGIVSHLTSLVLVDEVGDTQSELPTMRKIALPKTSSANAMHMFAAYGSSAVYESTSLRADSSSYSALSESAEFLRSSSPTRGRSDRQVFKSLSVPKPPARPDRLQVVRLIDWGDNPEGLIHGDFSGLHPEVQRLINELSCEKQLRRLSEQYEMPQEIVAIALLANFASDENPRARRVWSAIFKRLREDLQNRIWHDFMEPLEAFFGEADDRLTRLVAELAHVADGNLGRFDSNPGKVVREIASKTQARCQAIIHELAAEATHRLEGLVQARIAEAEQEFLAENHRIKAFVTP